MDLKRDVNSFLISWHNFPIDYWWRKKYKVPFGSKRHREMNFIDMYIEYREEIEVKRALLDYEDASDKEDDENLGLNYGKKDVIKLSKEQIDEDYDNFDLEQFDKK